MGTTTRNCGTGSSGANKPSWPAGYQPRPVNLIVKFFLWVIDR
jgi:hypothetical protein